MHYWNITFDIGEQMNAHECNNRLKDWVSKNKKKILWSDRPDTEYVNVNELIDELNQLDKINSLRGNP